MIDSTIETRSAESSNKTSFVANGRTQEDGRTDGDSAGHTHTSLDNRFACNICLDAVSEPVVTQCGHLYCWPCLYQWLAPGMTQEDKDHLNLNAGSSGGGRGATADHSRRSCPVCKSDCSVTTLVPIYVREVGTRQQGGSQQGLRQQPSDEDNNSAASANLDGPHSSIFPNEPSSEEMDGDTDIGLSISSERETFSHDGLRRRHISSNITSSSTVSRPLVPMRPLPPRAPTSPSSTYSNHVQQTHASHATNPTTYSAPQLALHQSLFQALLGMQIPTSPTNNGQGIPSLHRPRDHDEVNPNDRYANSNVGHSRNGPSQSHTSASHVQATGVSTEDSAMEFLSRLLLMLGSFVILCLLLF